ncbi:MAG: MFS transporter [Eubacteriaceae bacterium]|nr:MFS transporter [Eubacteriaceae bacterium]
MSEKVEVSMDEIQTTWRSWFVCAMVGLQYAASNAVRQVWTTAIPLAGPELGITQAAAGGLNSAYYIGYVISNLIFGYLVDAIGPKISLAVGTVFSALFTFLIPFASGYPMMFVLRMAAGLSNGALFAGVAKYQISWFSPQTRATGMTYMMAFSSIGASLASIVLAPIMVNQGWKAGFNWAAGFALACGALMFAFGTEQGPALQRIKKDKDNPPTPEEKKAERDGLMAVIGKKSFIIGTIGCFLNLGMGQGFNTWINSYFIEIRGFTIVEAGLIIGVTASLRLFTGPLAGVTSDILRTKKKLSVFGATTTVIMTLFLMYGPGGVSVLYVIMILRTIFSSFAGTPLNALQSQAAAGKYAGRAMGMYNAVAQVGSVIFPAAYGMIIDKTGGNFTATLWFGIVLTIAVAVCIANMEEIAVVKKEKAAA